MTGFEKIRKYQPRTQHNNKDGHGQNRPKPLDWEGSGFVRTGWNSHSYAWGDSFPPCTVQPGQLGQDCGIVAKCGDVVEIWAYGTEPGIIKEWLDDQILEIMRHDADLVEAEIDWAEFEEAMEVEGMVIPF